MNPQVENPLRLAEQTDKPLAQKVHEAQMLTDLTQRQRKDWLVGIISAVLQK